MHEDHVVKDCDVILTTSAGYHASLLKYVERDLLILAY